MLDHRNLFIVPVAHFSMPDTAIVEKAKRQGRLLAELGLEQRVLANGVLPSQSLWVRAGVVEGIIDSLLESGEWGEAVKIALDPHSQGRLLYDRPVDFTSRIVESSKKARRNLAGHAKALDLMASQNMGDTILRLVDAHKADYYDIARVYELVSHNLSGPTLAGFLKTLATSAERTGHLNAALQRYSEVNDTESLHRLFDSLVTPGAHFGNETFSQMVAIVREEKATKREKLTRLVRSQLTSSPYKQKCEHAPKLFKLFKEHKLALNEGEISRLYGHTARSVSEHDLFSKMDRYLDEKNFYDTRLKLLWAQLNVKKDPKGAYEAFKHIGYKGHEVLEAARNGLAMENSGQNEYSRFSIENIENSDLRLLLYDKRLKLDTRVQIAGELRDTDEFLNLSIEASNAGDHRLAYRAWLQGNGNLQEPHFMHSRQHLFDEAKEENRPHLYFVETVDREGVEQAYRLLMDKKEYREAMEFARSYGAPSTLYESARLAFINADPAEAYQFFSRVDSETKKPLDAQGAELAFSNLAAKHSLSLEEARTILPYTSQNPSGF